MSARLREAIVSMIYQIELIALNASNFDLMFRARDLRVNLRGL